MEAEKWKGLTVLTERATIQTKSKHPFTEYWISGAMPQAIEWAPSFFAKMQGTLYTLLLPLGETFEPSRMIDGDLPPSYQIVTKENIEENFAALITKERINVALLGTSRWRAGYRPRVQTFLFRSSAKCFQGALALS